MHATKVYGRIVAMKLVVYTDTGETLEFERDKKEIQGEPGLSSIHSVSSALGHMFGHDIARWVLNNPVPSQLITDMREGKIRLSEHVSIRHVAGSSNVTIEGYDKVSWQPKTYVYNSWEDASDDLEYCKRTFKMK